MAVYRENAVQVQRGRGAKAQSLIGKYPVPALESRATMAGAFSFLGVNIPE